MGKLQKDDEPVVKGAPFSKDVGWDKRWYEGPESELKIDGQREIPYSLSTTAESRSRIFFEMQLQYRCKA